MPVLLVRRDHRREDVLVRPFLAGAVVPGPALLDADLADEGDALELLEADRAGGTRLRRDIVRLEAERAIEDGPERAARDFGGLSLTCRSTAEDPPLPELALRVRPISDDELAIEHLGIASAGALEHAILADPAGADVEDEGRDRPVRDELQVAHGRGVGVIIHVALSYV